MEQNTQNQPIQIIAEPQFEPQVCKFTVDRDLVQGGSFTFNSKEEAKGSTLAEKIFEAGPITSLFISKNFINVTKQSDADWRVLGKDIGKAIREAIGEGKALISEEVKKNIPTGEPLRQKVTEVLNERVNPSIAAHGGHIDLIDIHNNDIVVKMGGGCQGCASSQATLKQGIEKILRKEIPGLGAIIDGTDHEAGTNPYF